MRKKVLTRNCTGCNDCMMNENNQLYCDWGISKTQKILVSPKRKNGYPACKLLRTECLKTRLKF